MEAVLLGCPFSKFFLYLEQTIFTGNSQSTREKRTSGKLSKLFQKEAKALVSIK
jgi:hypothetical protein